MGTNERTNGKLNSRSRIGQPTVFHLGQYGFSSSKYRSIFIWEKFHFSHRCCICQWNLKISFKANWSPDSWTSGSIVYYTLYRANLSTFSGRTVGPWIIGPRGPAQMSGAQLSNGHAQFALQSAFEYLYLYFLIFLSEINFKIYFRLQCSLHMGGWATVRENDWLWGF